MLTRRAQDTLFFVQHGPTGFGWMVLQSLWKLFRMPTFTKTINPRDIRYATTITVNGKDFKVLIDTGSIDLWLSTPEDFQAIDTGADAIAAFGAGVAAAFVNGTVSTATLQVGPFTLQNQGKSFFFLEHGAQSKFQVAFNNAKPETITATGVLELGLDGTLGIGPVGTFSPIAQGLTDARMDPSNNFFAVSLSRTGDQQGTADVSFTINEIDPTYSAIANTQPIPLFPSNTGVWSIPSSVPGTSPGTTVFQLDTGTPTAAMSQQLLDAIYSQIPGSIFLQDQEMWTVPCNSTSILSLQIGGQEFPIHPLDLSDIMTLTESNTVVCGSPFGIGSADTFDVLAGDSFMRNFYSLFNFGAADGSGPGPSIQLLSSNECANGGSRCDQCPSGPHFSGKRKLAGRVVVRPQPFLHQLPARHRRGAAAVAPVNRRLPAHRHHLRQRRTQRIAPGWEMVTS
ncbi:aspartic peptidase domain-containing protein [Roridomyces roridus]|uniref:Aspartic peptidase domain-containing protein n=1 Tax=Roridomyces roridus TaxID=1738132 RepID=A0AAD7BLH3_9AGAR|nr:aspartic peptidase domain-containing protein [Roridomyces roridus]